MTGGYRVASLVDTNVMVYCYDPSDMSETCQRRATSYVEGLRQAFCVSRIRPWWSLLAQ